MSQIPLPAVEKPPRPVVTEELVRRAALEVVPKMFAFDSRDFDNLVRGIVAQYRYPMDGYELTKELEKYEGWDLNRDDMETLDEVEGFVSEYLKDAEKAWFETYDIQPPHPIGTRIKEGVIDHLCDYMIATYAVKQNGCTQDGRFILIKFEKAVAVEVTNEAK